MQSTAACKFALVSCIAISSLASAHATDKPPAVVHDPVLKLRYTIPGARLEVAPPELFEVCAELVNDIASRQSWIFAKVNTPAGTVYVLGGYFVRRDPVPADSHKYESDDNGALVRVSGEKCEMIDPANGSFGAGSALAPDVLEPLAADLRRRLETGFGGRALLKRAMRAQKISTSAFAPAAQRGFGEP
jgi:hypothetical protein